jgi:hypothetical protein
MNVSSSFISKHYNIQTQLISIELKGGMSWEKEVNLSTPRPEGWGLLKVHPEARFPPRL